MKNLTLPSKIYIIRPNLKVQAAESHISNGLKDGFLDLKFNCKIINSLELIKEEENILIIDDLANYRSERNISYAKKLYEKGIIIALWVYWPIPKESKYYQLHNKLIRKNLNIFRILYGERELTSMSDFEKLTNRKYYKIPNASPKMPKKKSFNKINLSKKDDFDVVFIGSNMKSKSFLFKKVIPLLKKINPSIKVGLFGRGFNKRVRIANAIIKISNIFIAPLSNKLNNFVIEVMSKLNQVISTERELRIYQNSKICINYHEDSPKHIIYNLRYFKIPFYGGFQIVDSPLNISPYFNNHQVVHINSANEKEWVDIIIHYLTHPLERYKIQIEGNKKALKSHSYKERAKIFLSLYSDLLDKDLFKK
tara:strand:+ start:1431 stop:2528 length:1098 start_codon:yes stop_codon:yes gene_type:complete